jgi:hypothetical protein
MLEKIAELEAEVTTTKDQDLVKFLEELLKAYRYVLKQ